MDETEGKTYRCKLCIEDRDRRISDAARFELETAEDYAKVLRHALEEHLESEDVAEIMDFSLTTPCAQCGEPFVSDLKISSDGLVVRNFCDGCAVDVERLIHRSVSINEVLPFVTPAKLIEQ